MTEDERRREREKKARYRAKQRESGRAVPASELLDGPSGLSDAERVAAHLRGELSVRELAGESWEQWMARGGRAVSTAWARELVPLSHPPNYQKPAHDPACDCRRCHRGA